MITEQVFVRLWLFDKNYKLIAADLRKQRELGADPRVI